MNTIFMNSQKCKMFDTDTHRWLPNVSQKINLKRGNKYVALSNLCIYNTWKNKSKISGPTWNKKFELADGSYSASGIQNCFKYIINAKSVSIYKINKNARK